MHKTKRAFVRLLIPKLNSSFPLIQLRVKTHAPLVRFIVNSEGCSSISSCWLKASQVGQDGQPNHILPRNLPPAPTVNVVVSGASVRGDAMGDGIGMPGQRRGSPSWAPLKPSLLDGCISHPSENLCVKVEPVPNKYILGGTLVGKCVPGIWHRKRAEEFIQTNVH